MGASDPPFADGPWYYDDDADTCQRCGGDGFVEHDDSPDMWGEDCPSEKNHLIECPECCGYGSYSALERAKSNPPTPSEGGG